MRACVIIPTFDNARFLAEVVQGVLEQGLPVLVVDDGSTDRTPEILAGFDPLVVLRHERNRGKGAALKTGFAAARELGFSHAVTIDSDGQHLPVDIGRFLAAARADPAALVLGNRDFATSAAGRGARFGRAFSNFWTLVETGLRLPDTQSGYRLYPLETVGNLELETDGYDLEIEVLVKAAWCGIPITSVPVAVRYFAGFERVSHFRPVVDFARISILNSRLVTRRLCQPAPVLAAAYRLDLRSEPFFRRLLLAAGSARSGRPVSPARLAASAGLGLGVGLLPVWGFRKRLVRRASRRLGLFAPAAEVAAGFVFPAIVPICLALALVSGRLLLGPEGGLAAAVRLCLAPADVLAWLLGSGVLALAGGTIVLTALLASRAPNGEEAPSGSTPPNRRLVPLPLLLIPALLALLALPVAGAGLLRLPAPCGALRALLLAGIALSCLLLLPELVLIAWLAAALGLVCGLGSLGFCGAGAGVPVALALAAASSTAALVLTRAYLLRFRLRSDRVPLAACGLVAGAVALTLVWRGGLLPGSLADGWIGVPVAVAGVLLLLPLLCRAVLLRGGPNGAATLRLAYHSLWILWVFLNRGVRFLLRRPRRAGDPELTRAAVECVRGIALRLRTDFPMGRRVYLGEDRLPRAGPLVLVANHESMYDIVAILALPHPTQVLVKRWVWRMPLMGAMVRAAGYILLEEEAPERLIERARRSFERGFSILVFPEGTRTRTGRMGRFRNGAFAIARALGVRVIPIAMVNTREVAPRNSWFVGEHDVRIVVLDPLDPADYVGDGADRRMARDARDRIARCCRREWAETQYGPDWHRIPAGMYRYQGLWLGIWARAAVRSDPLIRSLPRLCPGSGRVVVVDSGFGLGVARLALAYPERPITAVEADPEKLRAARAALGDRFHVEFVTGDPLAVDLPPAEWIVLDRALTNRSDAEAQLVLARLAGACSAATRLLLREVIPAGTGTDRARLERFHSWACREQGAGVRPPASARSIEDVRRLLEQAGFVVAEECAGVVAAPEALLIATSSAETSPPG